MNTMASMVVCMIWMANEKLSNAIFIVFFFKQRLCPINYTPVHGYISKKNCYTFPPPPTIAMHGFSLANVLAFFRIRIIEKENFSFAGNVKKRRKKKLFVCG